MSRSKSSSATGDQIAIDSPPCAWCGAPATEDVCVEPMEVRSVKGVKTIVHQERRVPACGPCARVERDEAPPKEIAARQRAAERKKWKDAQESLL